MKEFLNMMETTSNRAGAIFRDGSYLSSIVEVLGPSKNAGVAIAKHGGKAISGVLFLDDFEGKTRYYLHAGSYDEARKLRGNPALALYLLMGAKDSGYKFFDFYGVSPLDEPNHRWAGFSSFKRSFGGYDLVYSGTWELPVNKTHYKLMNGLRGITKH
jgi:lipid II:glycine glycyltransferase (peptidoglycan interpeptide bridge formation enzyme)